MKTTKSESIIIELKTTHEKLFFDCIYKLYKAAAWPRSFLEQICIKNRFIYVSDGVMIIKTEIDTDYEGYYSLNKINQYKYFLVKQEQGYKTDYEKSTLAATNLTAQQTVSFAKKDYAVNIIKVLKYSDINIKYFDMIPKGNDFNMSTNDSMLVGESKNNGIVPYFYFIIMQIDLSRY